MNRSFCEECFKKQQIIDKLTEENTCLKSKLHYQERKADEGFFGSSTPSSKIPIKANTDKQNERKRGGAKPGHKGHGRKAVTEATAEFVIELETGEKCPRCGGDRLEDRGIRERTVLESKPVKAQKILYRLRRKRCLDCRRIFQAETPGVLPKSLYGNQIITHIAVMHYLHGISLGRIEAQLGVPFSALVQILHRLARLFSKVPARLIEQYRQSAVRHADETSWRTDGRSGYAWLFATEKISLFQFKKTRSSEVPKRIFGPDPLPGVLVVDRYAGYNKVPCAIQYCYAHLLREVQDLEKEFPDDSEVAAFVGTVAPLLSLAMGLKMQKISDKQFYRKAAQSKAQLVSAMNRQAKHMGIRRIQDIFREKEKRLYHWAQNRDVPAHNNLAERDLRPTVIARKVSFGSQSDEGAKTREILMTVLHTLKKQSINLEADFKAVLDQLAKNIKTDPYQILFDK